MGPKGKADLEKERRLCSALVNFTTYKYAAFILSSVSNTLKQRQREANCENRDTNGA